MLSHQELEAARSCRAQKLIARGHELQGRIQTSMDARADAAAALDAALDIATRIDHPSVVWRARGLRAELARRNGEAGVRERELATARQLIEALAPGVPDGSPGADFLRLTESLGEPTRVVEPAIT